MLPCEVDVAHYEECRLLIDEVAKLSRKPGANFTLSFRGNCWFDRGGGTG